MKKLWKRLDERMMKMNLKLLAVLLAVATITVCIITSEVLYSLFGMWSTGFSALLGVIYGCLAVTKYNDAKWEQEWKEMRRKFYR